MTSKELLAEITILTNEMEKKLQDALTHPSDTVTVNHLRKILKYLHKKQTALQTLTKMN